MEINSTEHSQSLPRRQPQHQPDRELVDRYIAVAVFNIHKAICEETGASFALGEAPAAYRKRLNDRVQNIVEVA